MNAASDPGGRWRGGWPVAGLALAWSLATGCDGPSSEQPAQAEAAGDRAQRPSGTTPGDATMPPAAPASLMSGVIAQAIEPPTADGRTWRVDAYVAALITEQLRRSPLPFTPWRSDGSDPARPSTGYRVGPLAPDDPWTALGLREGDIVQAVNGVSTADAGWADEALRRSDNQATVMVFRDDVSITLAYRLVDGLAWQALRQPSTAAGSDGDGDVLAVADPPPFDAASEDLRGVGVGAGAGAGKGGGASSGALPSAPSSPSVAPGSGGSGGARPSAQKGTATVARCSSADICSIDRAYWNGLVASPSKLESQADVVPAIRDDVFSGYKLRTVRPGSAVAQLGFRSGDKITHVNGRDVTDEAEALQIYLGLSGTRVFKVRYVRDGSTRTKTITVE
jgi:PDZ domain